MPDDELDSPRLSLKAVRRLRYDQGLILHPRQWYLGFRRLLLRVEQLLVDNRRLQPLNPPGDIIRMFDKSVCHHLCEEHGLPVPDAIGEVGAFDLLVEKMRQGPVRRVFVKPRHGSSASGMAAFETNGDRFQVHAPIEAVRNNGRLDLYNSLTIDDIENWTRSARSSPPCSGRGGDRAVDTQADLAKPILRIADAHHPEGADARRGADES